VKWNKSLNTGPKSKKGSNKTAGRITDLSHETKTFFRNWQANQKYEYFRAFYRPKFRSHTPTSLPLQLLRYRQIVQGNYDHCISWGMISWYELMWRGNQKEPPFLITTCQKTWDHGHALLFAVSCINPALIPASKQGLVPDRLPTQISCVTCHSSR